jgi:hypothetical protein
VVGEAVAGLVCEGRAGDLDLSPFSSRRFGRPPALRGLYRDWPF